MNRRDPETRTLLCAEYALGTMSATLGRRFERWLAEDPALAAELEQWREQLDLTYELVPEQRPPERVWRSIQVEIGAPTPGSRGWWQNLALWRSASFAASLAAVALALVLIFAPLERSGTQPAPGFAVLADGQQRAAWLVTAVPASADQVAVHALLPAPLPAEKSLELWAIPADGGPVSLGLLLAAADPPSSTELRLTLPSRLRGTLGEVAAFAVSLEPSGGSTTGAPTGPVLFQGKWITGK